jgi:hypothetical protein
VPANLLYAIDNAAVATIVKNTDGTATLHGVSVGTANETVTDTVFNLVDHQVVTVTPQIPTAITQTASAPF